MFSRHFCCKCNVSVVVCWDVLLRDERCAFALISAGFLRKMNNFLCVMFCCCYKHSFVFPYRLCVYRASHVVNGTREWIRPLCHEWNLCISLNKTLLHSWERAEWMCTFRSNKWIWVFYINIRCIWETTFSWAVTLKSVGTAPFTSHWLSIRINIPQEQVFVLYLA